MLPDDAAFFHRASPMTATSHSFAVSDQAQLRDLYVAAMSKVACTVNLVTTDGPAGRAGTTVSAMASVSADGDAPVLLVCINNASSCLETVMTNGVFCLNVLRDDQTHVSDVFARRRGSADGDKFSCADWTAMATGSPRVQDVLVAFDCRVLESKRVGTHQILFGAVQDVHVSPAGAPLAYANRGYARVVPHSG